jgi:predicted nucleic acid-binding protein
VASAEQTYVDPSALRSLYVHDDRSAGFCRWRRRVRGSLPITRFGRAEIVNSIHLAVHRRAIDDGTAKASLADLDDDLRQGRLTLVDALWRRALDLASGLSTEYTARLGTRTLDVLHVATAVTLDATHFVTYDRRQAALARAVRLRALAP